MKYKREYRKAYFRCGHCNKTYLHILSLGKCEEDRSYPCHYCRTYNQILEFTEKAK